MKFLNRSHPTHETELQDIEPHLQSELMHWYKKRVNEVKIDLRTVEGSLKKETIQHLVMVLKRKAKGDVV